MAVNSDVSEPERLGGMETPDCERRTKSTRKRKSDDFGGDNAGAFPSCPDFTSGVRSEKLTVVNSQDAFFDKHSPRRLSSSPIAFDGNPFESNDRILKPAKSFFDDDERVPCAVNNTGGSPHTTPRPFRPEFRRMPSSTQTPTPSHYYCTGVGSTPTPSHYYCTGVGSTPTPSHYYCTGVGSTPTPSHNYCTGVGSTPTPSHYCTGGGSPLSAVNNCTGGGSPLSVVDELFTGFYGCMPQWECALPWRGDSEDSNDNDDGDAGDTKDEEEDEDEDNDVVHRSVPHRDAESVREHLSVPKHLGREYASQPAAEESRREQNTASFGRTIRRTPSSRLTTLESDSRQRMPGSKMFRRTEINRVTEIHWDEKVLDTSTLELMAKLSVN
eukprot:CAMPEP_0172408284 /NCGR_PEP_ID=MMETSP1061-20121228/75777_1 /TAXON_ID=37318 /ORGANISM="Pseudo-nitzschia pungens, Strain cf. pungens" /LENGTH=383 /DNA_ID=CAMNT_0013144409 /DNA_START=26 /DNA_END=1177 /DNA_ORIENTATION=+